MHKFFRLSMATLLVFALSALAFAQSTTTGAIGLVVTDPQGAVVPNAGGASPGPGWGQANRGAAPRR